MFVPNSFSETWFSADLVLLRSQRPSSCGSEVPEDLVPSCPHWQTLLFEQMLIMFGQIVCSECLFRIVVENLVSELLFPGDLIRLRSWRLGSYGRVLNVFVAMHPRGDFVLNKQSHAFRSEFCPELFFRICVFRRRGA